MNTPNIDRIMALKTLKNRYKDAISICDPIEYKLRQRDLLYEIAEFLLQELEDYENEKVNEK